MRQTSVKTRRKFDETFKREAIQNWLVNGKSAEVIAQELGLKATGFMPGSIALPPRASGGGKNWFTRRPAKPVGRYPVH
jgi:hypothetical protein